MSRGSEERMLKSEERNGIKEPAQQLSFTFSATVIPRGDGSFTVLPGKPVREMRPQAAAKEIGVCKTTLYEMIAAGRLETRRPSPGVIWVRVDGDRGLAAWRTKTSDPEFWERGG